MPRVGVQGARAGATQGIERVDRNVTGATQVGLVSDVGEAELVGAGQHVAGRLRVGVEAQDLQLLAGAGAEAEVGALVVREAAAVPQPEILEVREAPGAGGRIDGVGAETEGDVAVGDVGALDVEPQPGGRLPGVAEGRLPRVGGRERG